MPLMPWPDYRHSASLVARRKPTSGIAPEDQMLLEIRRVFYYLLDAGLLDQALLPDFLLHYPYHQVLVSDNIGVGSRKNLRHHMLKVILVGYDELAFRAVAAGLAQVKKAVSIHVDEQREFSHVSEAPAFRTLAPAHV